MKRYKGVVCLAVATLMLSSSIPASALGPMIPRRYPSTPKQEQKQEQKQEKKQDAPKMQTKKALSDGRFPGFSEDFKILDKQENKRQGSMTVVAIKDGKVESMRVRYLKGTQLKKDDYPQYLKEYEQMIVEKGVEQVGELKGHEEEGRIVLALVKDALERSRGYVEETQSGYTKGTLKDGTYLGKHNGFYPSESILVKVHVKNNAIENIEILNRADDKYVYEEKYMGSGNFAKSFVGKQDANVDVVTGATFTSKGVKHAVENALLQAQGLSDNRFPGFSNFMHMEKSPIKDGKRDMERKGTFLMLDVKEGKIDSVSVRNVDSKAIDRKNYMEETKYIETLQNQIKEKGLAGVELVKGKEKESEMILLALADAMTRSANFNKEFKMNLDSTKPLKDGTYNGAHHGFYTSEKFEVKVTVKNGAIESMEVVKDADDNFIRVDRDETRDTAKRFKKMLESYKGKKDANVDVTSGATFSSKGIQKAVEEALKKAQQ